MWGQLAIKALVSGALVAAASELARRSPAWGGLIASLPLVSLLALLWLWNDRADAGHMADFALSTVAYVLASLPAFVVLALILRGGAPVPLALAGFVASAFAGYLALGWIARTLGWTL